MRELPNRPEYRRSDSYERGGWRAVQYALDVLDGPRQPIEVRLALVWLCFKTDHHASLADKRMTKHTMALYNTLPALQKYDPKPRVRVKMGRRT